MSATFDTIKQRNEKVIMRTYGRYPLALTRAKGARLYDSDGKEYVDLLAGIAVCGLGHCRPELAKVMAEQADKLVHVSNLFYQEEQIVLAEKLLSTCQADKVFFCNSGAEANEGAIKLARRYMAKVRGSAAREILTLEGSFHGRTLATLTATAQTGKIKDGFEPLPGGFRSVPFADACALRAAVNENTAAVMVETVQGEGGVRPLPPEFVEALLALRREKGFLIIVDEVQTGMGRTGRFWAHEHYGITPDIFTVAKGLANGLPMGAVLATDEVARGFEPGTHATTFGGGGVLSAVASKVIDIMREERLVERAAELGAFFLGEAGKLQAKHPDKIAHVRGLGLMLGIELAAPGQDIWRALLDAGFVCNLTHERVLRLLPPLTIAREDLSAFLTTLDTILANRPTA
ncbi:MAG TPA: aspartate aminotransferase family protein [Desulfovibrio sp.]|uniref:aspartate aminotransferase family protein n=1 Tax=Desulfovibrio sp. TaxID=885 RepID=UPI002C8B18C5|nr:aspartate aminotransferase family protein [Desulfovibrio sp.]HMM38130.1 aspartate aminotransferase family protein [Desulfovibrio sp.]